MRKNPSYTKSATYMIKWSYMIIWQARVIQTVKFVKQLSRIQIQKGGKVLRRNQLKFTMEACYSELVQSQLFTLCRCQTNFSFTTAVELLLTWRRNWLKYKYALYNKLVLEGVTKKSRLTNCRFTTISSQISAIYMRIFHKTEVQTVNLRCWMGLYLDWFKSYDSKCNLFHFCFSAIL